MAITREQKEKQLAQLIEDLGKSRLTLAVNYRGLSVEDMQQLRRNPQAQAGNLKVIKKTLIKLGLSKVPALAAIKGQELAGPVALAFGFTDEVTPAQVLHQFAKTHPNLEVLAGFAADGTLLAPDTINQLATLPSKQQLQANLAGVIAGPAHGLVSVLAGNLRGLVQVLQAAAAK